MLKYQLLSENTRRNFKKLCGPVLRKLRKSYHYTKKDNDELVDDYRPVSLLTSFSKVFERVAYLQLNNYFKINKLFYNSQYGFREDHSTESASVELIVCIIREIDHKNNHICIYICIYMDLSKAFDTIDHDMSLNKLNYYGINGTELQWLRSYLTNRWQYVEIDSVKSSSMYITTGVPQGSIFDPLCFLIYIYIWMTFLDVVHCLHSYYMQTIPHFWVISISMMEIRLTHLFR